MANSLGAGELKYCPFCGEKMPWANKSLRFCPACGEKLAFAKTTEHLNDSRKTMIPVQNISSCNSLQLQANRFAEYDYFSIILKDCYNSQSLARRLEKLLMRSYFAIRLAVDTAPCIVIYKGKIESMVSLIKVFEQEKTAFSLLIGEINTNATIEEIFANFHQFPSETQRLIRSVPIKLWLGDQIFMVLSDIYAQTARADANGILVVTDQALYLINGNTGNVDYQWMVIPYYQIAEVSIDKENGRGLVIIYKDNNEDVLFINDKQQLADVYEHVRRAVNNRMSCLLFKTLCTNCNYSIQEKIDMENYNDLCEKCGQKLIRKLLKKE